MTFADQAAGLRQWAGNHRGSSPPHDNSTDAVATCKTLVVVGLPGVSPFQSQRVLDLLKHWDAQGRRWVGSSAQWRVVPVEITSPHLPLLLTQQPRWALWVDNDPNSFRRAFGILTRLKDRQGPHRLLAVHAPEMPRKGLLDNLQQAAWSCLSIDLLVMTT
ncbi:hypothetical protein QLQ86_18950 [Halomonas sp. LR5S13]|uniref:hypothetical protein n=1 Tax=Halomonas rhizosphaerae TaxID=3043296 RepID=UPI0024A8DDFA|nr:hypothetical protein [Halomonas rhizosphaerae]MDI5922848.1 hypothetical protein [Halomonas rhizosphaerae]